MDIIIEKFDFTHIQTMALWLCITYGIVFLAMFVDLVAGVRKAIQNGVARTSTGYKKTCAKANKYYSPMVRLTFIDLLASAFIVTPIFTMLWGAWCLWCEYVSVTEKALTKKELRDAENTMQVIIKNKGDIAQILFETIKQMNADDIEKLKGLQKSETDQE